MARALVRHAAPYVLSHEDGAAERHRPAVVTPRHAWRRAGVLLMAAGSRGLRRLAPRFAQKRGVLADAHHQHDRENSCSKHVTPATGAARVAPPPLGMTMQGNQPGFLESGSWTLPDMRDFADQVPKIPQLRVAPFNEALRWSASLVAPKLLKQPSVWC